jgi:RepB plasmid partitioning protein
MQDLGMVEPLVIHPAPNDSTKYLLLQRHLRLDILRTQGAATVRCLIAKDDEAYTYNKRISPLSTVQEHHMLVKAINDGVSEERIASALHIDLKTLRQKRELLVGICTEAADLLKDKTITAGCFSVLRKMTAMRQIEAAELMITVSNYSVALVKTVLAASSPDQIAKPGTRKAPRALSPDQLAQLEQEMTNTQAGLAALKDAYGADRLELQVACRYLKSILANPTLAKYLIKNHADLFRELEQITRDVCSGDQGSA